MNRSLPASMSLGFTAGYVDTVGFVALFGLFTAHVTGNFVLIGSELANPTHGVLIKLLAFPAFIAAVASSRLLALQVAGRRASVARALVAAQWLLLAACLACGLQARPVLDPQGDWALATGMFAAAAMGVQNAAGRLAWSTLAPTTVMTGNVTQLVIDIVDLLRAGGADPALRERIGKFFWPVAAFAAGAISGAFAYHFVSFWALALPLLVLAVPFALGDRA